MTHPVARKAVIVGTGLIGGSLALMMRKRRLAGEVVGISRHRHSIDAARRMGAIDRGSCSLSAAKGADLLILATPVSVMIQQAPLLARLVAPGCVVTDVGSTKLCIVDRMDSLFPRFVGSHPLAGSEKRGIVHADERLFEGSLCILTPGKKSDPAALRLVRTLWKEAGARLLRMSAHEHDKALAYTSHVPHAVAFSLMNAQPRAHLGLAAGSLKDTTRVAASDEEIWADIFLSNRRGILAALSAFSSHLGAFERALRRNDAAGLKALIAHARAKRLELETIH